MTITRGTKTGGGTDFATGGGTIKSSEVDTDLNTVYTKINGNLDTADLKAAANIATSQVGDYSVDKATSRISIDPAGSAAPSLATTLEDELERLRRQVMRMAVGQSALRNDGTASADEASWQDRPHFGPNLLRNSSFERYTSLVAGAAPDGWDLIATPTTVTQENTPVSEGDGKNINIVHTAGSSNEGIDQTLAGLPASGYLVVGCRVSVTAGTFRLKTTGADGTDHGDLNLTHATATWTTISGVIVLDATPTDIVVRLLSANANADFNVDRCFAYLLDLDPIALPLNVPVFETSTNTAASHYVSSTPTAALVTGGATDLLAAVTVPGPGYYITVHGGISTTQGSGTNSEFGVQIYQDKDGGGYGGVGVAGMGGWHDAAGEKIGGSAFYVLDNPTPGSTYTFKVYGLSVGLSLNALTAQLFVEMKHAGGG